MTVADVVARYRAFERDLALLTGPARFDANVNMRLDRITHLLDLLGNPQHAFPAIHVGGTSGKGSTAAMAAAMLSAAGYKTGLFLSPHLQVLNECYQIDSRMVRTSRLAACLAAIKPSIAQVAATNAAGTPTSFEVQVVLACLLFQQEAVDTAVIEVGLGGTFDATNVVPARVAVITSIGFDHTDVLGDTLEAIAHAKAGIIKPGQVVVSGVQQPEAHAIIARRCGEQRATLWQMGTTFDYTADGTGRLSIRTPSGSIPDLAPGMPGRFQGANAACAVAAVQALPGFTIPEAAVRQGLRLARLPGRMEVVQTHPTVLLDGAHNPDKLRAAVQVILEMGADKRRIVVLGLKTDKDARALLPHVLAHTDRLIVTAFRARALWEPLPPGTLAELAASSAPHVPVRVVPDPGAAVALALAEARPADLIWVTGSLYLVGDVRERWHPSAEILAKLEA